MSDITTGLNPEQLKAVNHLEGPLLILAGAGSGKTKVLTCRIANLLSHGVSPYAILAITFTNKAAREMRDRVDKMIGDCAKNVWLSTFHSFCAKFLRMEIEADPQYTKNFAIYDSSESQTLVKQCLKELNLSDKQYQPNAIAAAISNAKNQMLLPADYRRQAYDFFQGKIADVYDLYQRELVKNNALDFDDLLLITVNILENSPEILDKYQRRFQYVLVDEYQDTNSTQYRLTNLLAHKSRNLCVVGDADQSIYGWRGADISNILNFEHDYPDATVIKLEQNYRSTKTILKAANQVIENNIDRKAKNLWTDNPTGDKIIYYKAADDRDEVNFITQEIAKQKDLFQTSYSDVAVLYRTNAQSRTIEEGFMRSGIPYTMVGGLKFYDRKEIKDIIAYLKLIYNPHDSLALKRIINVPKRSIGATTVNKLEEFAASNNISLFEAITTIDMIPLSTKTRNLISKFAELIFHFISIKDTLTVHELINRVMYETGYITSLEEEKTVENLSRIDNIKELLSVATEFQKSEDEPTLESFLQNVALITDLDNTVDEADCVTLMTMHTAKGLEYPIVFIAGMEEGLFPHSRTLMNETELEEERRICYVGITRAERKLYLTNARNRMLYGKIVNYPESRFMSEIPTECMELRDSRGRINNSLGNFSQRYGLQSKAPHNHSFLQREMNATANRVNTNTAATAKIIKPDLSITWKVGDKVQHAKWGIGTVVSIKGSGEEIELKIAFPGEGIKALMQKYAPISKA